MNLNTFLPWARAALLLALSFAATETLAVRTARAAQALESGLAAAGITAPPELVDRLGRLRAAEVPITVLETKLQEGRAKGVPAARLLQVLSQMADDLLWMNDRLESCQAAAAAAKPQVLVFGSDVLLSGVTRDELAPALPLFCKSPDPAAATSQTAEIYFHLVNRMNVARARAWVFARELLRRGEAKGALGSLVGVLQDIQRSRGSLDRPLEVATLRLQSGVSLRAIKNELSEQYLRP